MVDPDRIAEVRGWLVKAATDLRAADYEMTANPPLFEDIVFHAQQAVEKTLKAFLSWHDRPFRKTHNLVELGEACAAIEPSFESLLRRAATLTEYAWKYRYPGDPEELTGQETEGARMLGHEVFQAIAARLPAEVRP
jgi:HEPN domain-containing protein